MKIIKFNEMLSKNCEVSQYLDDFCKEYSNFEYQIKYKVEENGLWIIHFNTKDEESISNILKIQKNLNEKILIISNYFDIYEFQIDTQCGKSAFSNKVRDTTDDPIYSMVGRLIIK